LFVSVREADKEVTSGGITPRGNTLVPNSPRDKPEKLKVLREMTWDDGILKAGASKVSAL
jgi:hypothetical protein